MESILEYMQTYDFENLFFCQDKALDFKAIIAIHDTTLGPATGGCRMWQDYSSEMDAVEDACAEALSEGVHSAAVILNILARRREPPPPLTIATPEALRLTCEPVADCTRYDSLRRADHGKIGVAGRDEPAQALRNEGGL